MAHTLNMFEDYVKVFTLLFDRLPRGRRLGVVSNAGFECASVLDKLYALEPAVLSDATRARLRERLPGIAHADNPVDTTPMATTAQLVAAAAALLEDPGVDALLVSPIPVSPALEKLAPDLAGSHSENICATGSLPQELIRPFRETRKPMAVVGVAHRAPVERPASSGGRASRRRKPGRRRENTSRSPDSRTWR